MDTAGASPEFSFPGADILLGEADKEQMNNKIISEDNECCQGKGTQQESESRGWGT